MTAPGTPALSRGGRIRVILLGGALPIAIALVGILLMLSWLPELPDPIAVHWGIDDEPNRFGPLWSLIVLLAAIIVPFSAFSVGVVLASNLVVLPALTSRFWVAISVWMATLLTVGLTAAVAEQRGLTDAADAPGALPTLLLGFVAAVVLAVAVWFLTPKHAPVAIDAGPLAVDSYDLVADERVYWSRAVTPHVALFVAFCALFAVTLGGVAVAVVLLDPQAWAVLVPVIVVVLLAALLFFWRVTVDHSGVLVRGVLGVPRFRIPLAEIASARAVEVNPLAEFGGWGIRWGLSGRFGVIVRKGVGLEVARVSGRVFVVTVDDAATAARLLNGLVARERV